MKTIEYYMNLPYKLEIIPDPDEGGYTIRYPDLPGCITVGDTLDEAIDNAYEAKRVWIEAALEEGIRILEPTTDSDFSGQFKLRIPKSLHRALAEHAKAEGTSMNQYCVYLLSMNDAMKQCSG